jgi:hypothetical protein
MKVSSKSETSASKPSSSPSKAEESRAKGPGEDDGPSTPTVRETPTVRSPAALSSETSAASDPDASREIVSSQADTARAASGQSEDPELLEYEQQVAELESMTPVFPGDANHAAASQLFSSIESVRTAVAREIGGAAAEAEQSLGEMLDQTAMVAAVAGSDGQFMTEEEQALLAEHAQEFLEPAVTQLETDLEPFLESTRDPMSMAVTGDLTHEEQLDFVETTVRLLGYTDSGQQRAGEWLDGLTGASEDPMAEMVADLRNQLEGDERDQLDRSLGLLAGIDRNARPDGYAERLTDLSAALDMDTGSESAFGQGEEVGGMAFSALAREIPGAVEGGADMLQMHDRFRNSRLLNLASDVGGGAAALLAIPESMRKLQEGEFLGAGAAALGAAAYAAKYVAPRLAPGLGWSSAVAAGAEFALNTMNDQAEFAVFRRDALDAALGESPLRDLLWAGTPSSYNLLNLSPDVPAREALLQRAEEVWPGWQTQDPGGVRTQFWILADSHSLLSTSNSSPPEPGRSFSP